MVSQESRISWAPGYAMSQVLLLLLERYLPAQGETWLLTKMLRKSRCCTCRREDEEVLLEPCQSNDVWGSQTCSWLPMQWCQQQREERARGNLWSTLVLRAGAYLQQAVGPAEPTRAGGCAAWG